MKGSRISYEDFFLPYRLDGTYGSKSHVAFYTYIFHKEKRQESKMEKKKAQGSMYLDWVLWLQYPHILCRYSLVDEVQAKYSGSNF